MDGDEIVAPGIGTIIAGIVWTPDSFAIGWLCDSIAFQRTRLEFNTAAA